ncbi:helix-turn-helix domain-containing protein [Curtobacterium ammoniigenes]|uniref:helix-turn-helix domain-containing protein n=1 Tax=Curtobacterium ammoniigenes TaxID=395387 RepID=UPI001C3F3292
MVGFVPPLDRLFVSSISARFLSQDERIEIADLRRAGHGIRQIAAVLNRAPSTVSRELRRNCPRGASTGLLTHRKATARRARDHGRRIHREPGLQSDVVDRLRKRWSPAQISRHLKRIFPGRAALHLCHESIYQLLYEPGSSFLRPSRLAPHRRSPLRTGRDHRRAHMDLRRRRPRFQQPMLTIHDRPFEPEYQSEAGIRKATSSSAAGRVRRSGRSWSARPDC